MRKGRRTCVALLVLGALAVAGVAAAALAFSAPFEVTGFRQYSTNPDGSPASQAGSTPYETDTSFTVSSVASGGSSRATGVVRSFAVDLPPGLVGNPNAVPKCARADFAVGLNGPGNPVCPSDTQVGVARVSLEGGSAVQLPVFDLVAPKGVPAQFGIAFSKFVAFLDAGVHPNAAGEYVVSIDAQDIQSRGFIGLDISLWGDRAKRPFLRLPTSCGAPQTLAVSVSTWEDPLTVVSLPGLVESDREGNPVVIGGCSTLDFSPSIEVTGETSATDTPTGLEVNLRVPENEDPNALAEAHVKDAVVTLPPGLTLSSSATNGEQACSPAQIGIGSVGELERPPACPAASKLGSLEVSTPLFEHPLQGEIYLAQQETVQGALIGVYLVVDDPLTGILVKLAGRLELGGQQGVSGLQPGQVRAVFENSPQLPFSDLKLELSGGPKASLVTPQGCASADASSAITGWNGTLATPSSNLLSTSGGCTQGFSPAFTAGTTDKRAGAYSPFTLTIGREDGSQRLGVIDVSTPPGFSGNVAGVTICPNAALEAAERRGRPGGGALEQADPSCPASSSVGTVTAAAGPGPDSISTTGREYLAGPYKGAPFDLVAITPAVSGPFDLGVVVLRQALYIDPHTGQATVRSDPIPTALDGVPLDVRSVTVKIDGVAGNNHFIFNPTNCSPMAVTGTLTSTGGTNAPISSPFQATNCAALKFKLGFAASTAGKAGKAGGASLHVEVTYPSAPQGTYANIKSVKVDLPKQLPARLTTLQKACPAASFEANPASCPAPSVVGTVVAHTPILNSPLTGPVYLVSHGNEAFPDVVMVLQGEGITLRLVGNTNVKKGITSNTFKSLPDAPLLSFELTLPQGPYSVLAAAGTGKSRYDLCAQTLAMPTAITAQNGAVLKQSTKITATGCPPVPHRGKHKKALTRAQKLRKALKRCRKEHSMRARSACEKKARHAYGSHRSPGRRRRLR